MTTIGGVPIPNRFQDRAAYAQWIAAKSAGRETAEQALARSDAEDLMRLESLETTASYARGEGMVIGIGDVVLNMRDPLTHYDQIYSGRAPLMPDGSSGSMTAFNVDFVVENQAKIADGDVHNIAYYAEWVQKSLEACQRVDPGYGFTGYAGTDRVTHDVNQYIDWMYQRADIERPKSLGEVTGAFTPTEAKPADLAVFLDAVETAAKRGAAATQKPQMESPASDQASVPAVGDSVRGTLSALRAEMMQLLSIDAYDTASAVMTLKKIGKIIDQIGGMGKGAPENQVRSVAEGFTFNSRISG